MELSRLPNGRPCEAGSEVWNCRAVRMVDRGKPRAICKWYGAKCVTVALFMWSTVASFVYYASGMERSVERSHLPFGRSLGVSCNMRMTASEVWNCRALRMVDHGKPRAICKWYGAKCVTVALFMWSTVASFVYYASGMGRNVDLSHLPNG